MYKIYICYDLDVVFHTSACIRSSYTAFITTTNAPVRSFNCSGNVVAKLPEQLNEGMLWGFWSHCILADHPKQTVKDTHPSSPTNTLPHLIVLKTLCNDALKIYAKWGLSLDIVQGVLWILKLPYYHLMANELFVKCGYIFIFFIGKIIVWNIMD